MMMITEVNIAKLSGRGVLAGALAGQALRPLVEEEIRRAPLGAAVVLDFANVELVTSSFFLAAFAWLWTSIEVERLELYPVLASVPEDSKEDIEIALEARRLRVLTGEFSAGQLRNVDPLGLDLVEEDTYRRVAESEETTAGDLFRAAPKIQSSAWSNRLAQLFSYRLLRRRKQGRELFYSLVWR
jgi:hypothetical protein